MTAWSLCFICLHMFTCLFDISMSGLWKFQQTKAVTWHCGFLKCFGCVLLITLANEVVVIKWKSIGLLIKSEYHRSVYRPRCLTKRFLEHAP